MKPNIFINEVGPRDGFQNLSNFVDTSLKMKIIDGLVQAGIRKIQFTSFVSPKAIPQLRDSREVATACLEKYADTVEFNALIANAKGAATAHECGVGSLSYVTSVTDSHNLENVNKTVAQSVEELRQLLAQYPQIEFGWDVAMAFGCAFEGPVSDSQILRHIETGVELGLRKFTLCDTIGIATPDLVKKRVSALLREFPGCAFHIHIHDTRNMGMLNTLAAIECGITDVETSLCGMGGCPFSPGASGNTATEDLVYMLNNMGYETGIDFQKLLSTALFANENIDGSCSGHHINIGSARRYQHQA